MGWWPIFGVPVCGLPLYYQAGGTPGKPSWWRFDERRPQLVLIDNEYTSLAEGRAQ